MGRSILRDLEMKKAIRKIVPMMNVRKAIHTKGPSTKKYKSIIYALFLQVIYFSVFSSASPKGNCLCPIPRIGIAFGFSAFSLLME
ncbi:MAG: hypothetical protein JW836_03875 [Deltaproteobacteria bacterium]|nr:hypothetical protein [Deltaproteobacteria bacterium]